MAGAFDVYRILTRQLAACPATAQLVTDQGVPLTSPFPRGARGGSRSPRDDQRPDDDHRRPGEPVGDHLSQPAHASTPLLINVAATLHRQIPTTPASGQPGAVHPLELPARADHQGDRRRLESRARSTRRTRS